MPSPMIFAEEPYVLHLLAGSTSINALDAVKALLDDGSHNVNERESIDNLSPLHIAAAWDNLVMCQLLVHYGADLNAEDLDKRKPIDIAGVKSRKFLKKLKNRRKRSRLVKILSYLFGGVCGKSPSFGDSASSDALRPSPVRRSCPGRVLHANLLPGSSPPKDSRLPLIAVPVYPSLGCSPTTPNTRRPPPAPPRGSSLDRDFLTSNNTGDSVHLVSVVRRRGEESAAVDADVSELMSTPGEEALLEELAKLSIPDLRQRLRERKCSLGPIDARSRRVYERKLARLELGKSTGVRNSTIIQYSLALQRVIRDAEAGSNLTRHMGEEQENAIRGEYLMSATEKREVVSYFCYLIIDPSMLPEGVNCSFRQFIRSIFYVGKGNRSRPLQHLVDAHRCRMLVDDPSQQVSNKLKRILYLWDAGHGVISLHISRRCFADARKVGAPGLVAVFPPCSDNIHSGEALAREAAMIEAIGIDNLTNVKKGHLTGVMKTWTKRHLTEFGAMLLRKAHVVFQNERCRPVFEADIEGIAARF